MTTLYATHPDYGTIRIVRNDGVGCVPLGFEVFETEPKGYAAEVKKRNAKNREMSLDIYAQMRRWDAEANGR